MLNRIIKHLGDTHPWVMEPRCLLDAFLDHLNKLHDLVLLPGTDEPSCRYVRVEARRREFGA